MYKDFVDHNNSNNAIQVAINGIVQLASRTSPNVNFANINMMSPTGSPVSSAVAFADFRE